MLHKPVVVYLDSSDISDLSNPLKRTDDLLKIESELFDLHARELIEFRFSMIHIIESAPKDENLIGYARQRFNNIYKLCNKKCIPSYTDILEHEISSLSSEINSKDLEIYNNNSIWFSEFDTRDSLNLKSMVDEYINSLPDREQKRKATKTLLTDNGEIRKGGLLKANLYYPSMINEIMDQYPLTHYEASS